ncbi:hypothetical protein A2X44_04175 [candidate division CPR3 bacterium GWF2_35_18]|uniref:LmbE family protein n=1 Tax=candidate division CPR3 bacterium GW2011_GWF2_35_18 TaxID=1618350 RepID=A0A0G0BIK8_UNCC3|nr:MAG: hypothetical protein UR67_C0007G0024 [candidate division CPR3 bacterium GW2011_GWF2_35_18]OGB62552.1 MAG: hypothetical protein A2X44_04175 [candidate division CPR3 bacterium GWF2_35_18]OGB65803.1 MAG: hypothetical protein A2250_01425 [candidate division CPR3 bacterium RIFOXYA2_FULL_35_13]OGB79279.1 MAG: hypothetical protein A2296_03885 [candidate division CPR3 bacterium RIFOXYB2_FULL_35_8]
MLNKQTKKHRLLVVMAHPDDESFGPGGTIAKYSKMGVETYLLTATKGESGNIHPDIQDEFAGDLGEWRSEELQRAAKILGIKEMKFLGFNDGTLCQNFMNDLTKNIITEIIRIKPQVIITFEPLGISKHLDHIAISHATTLAFYYAGNKEYLKENNISGKPHQALKLLYYVIPQSYLDKLQLEFRSGYPDEKITTVVDIRKEFSTKIAALKCHQSQKKDWERFLKRQEKVDLRYEFYHRAESFINDYDHHETDIFEGIDNKSRYQKNRIKEFDNFTLK